MMSRRSFTCLVVTLLAVTVLLVSAEPASAQRGVRGFGFGYSPGTGLNYGYGNAYGYGNPYFGSGYYNGTYNPWTYSYGQNFYPGSYGTGWNNPGYSWSGYNTNWGTPSYYSFSTPSYYTEGMQGNYPNEFAGAGFGFGNESYGALSGGGTDNRVIITTQVPPNAEIWFDDQKTAQTGPFRSFISPPLNEDRNFVYHIRARWTENGKQVEKDRRLEVHPGDRLFVAFTQPRSQGMEAIPSGGQYGNEPQNLNRDRTLDDTQRNRQENADRATENRTQQGNQNTTPGTTGTGNRTQPPAGQSNPDRP
jgi:uncharacterized protein (TIGR03000 family)